ncbi:MAG: AAA family ATPase [Proteobacteria bacterium]|nr:AAA family ATPase [Pseudomonadota bacterium]
MIIGDYQITEQVEDRYHYTVYKAVKPHNNDIFVIKAMKHRHFSPAAVTIFKKELKALQSLHLDGIVRAYDVIDNDGMIAIVEEDAQGRPIKEALNRPISQRHFLYIAEGLANILGHLHQHRIVFRDLSPENILWDETSASIRLKDYGIESLLAKRNEEPYLTYAAIDVLPYMSPEQTGRMNDSVDYRSDLYSLGVLFYELLSGVVPFDSKEPLKIIHGHLAGNIQPFHPDVPTVLSNIVMKLMEKNPDDRYQNSFCLMADIAKCQYQLRISGDIGCFEIAQNDTPTKYIVPNVLIGRNQQMQELKDAYKRAKNGGNEVLFVTGPSGIGKTAFVQNFLSSIAHSPNPGYVTSGKCEQYMTDYPYSASIQAFSGLIQQILSESDERIQVWKDKLLKAVGTNGKLMTDMFPLLESIIGKQPEMPEIKVNKHRNMFDATLKNFIRVFATEEHPLIIFIDDLQWVDRSTLNLSAFVDSSMKYIYFIGAYRDDELDSSLPLSVITEDIKKEKGIHTICLGGLDQMGTHQLIRCFLKNVKEPSLPLAELIWRKTGGNPLFINQLLKNIYDMGMLVLDPVLGWHWNLEKISEIQATDNVVALLNNTIKLLDEQVKNTLEICACMGSSFDIDHLAMVASPSVGPHIDALLAASDSGLIVMGRDKVWFLHNKIRETIYASIQDKDRQAIHYRIGKAFLQKRDKGHIQKWIFYIVDQLNQAPNLITDLTERLELADLNLQCARKSKDSSAYLSAHTYYDKALSMLPPGSWETNYDLSLGIYSGFIEIGHLKDDFKRVEDLSSIALAQARTYLDKLKICNAKIIACIAVDDLEGAIGSDLGLSGLTRRPKSLSKICLLKEHLHLKISLALMKKKNILHLPKMINPVKQAELIIGINLNHALYRVAPEQFAVMIMRQVRESLKHGILPEHANTYIAYGAILISVFGDIENGYRFGNLGLQIHARRPDAKNYSAMAISFYNTLIRPWKEHARNGMNDFMEGYYHGLESGDLLYAAVNISMHSIRSFLIGVPLPVLEVQLKQHCRFIKDLNQPQSLVRLEIFWQMVLNLMGRNSDPTSLTGEVLNDVIVIPKLVETNSETELAALYHCRMNAAILFHRYARAAEDGQELKKYLGAAGGSFIKRDFVFHSALIILATYKDQSYGKKRAARATVKRYLKLLKKMADHAPMNTMHLVYLVEAERSRVLSRNTKAERYYDLSIVLAGQNGYIQYKGYACELAARYYFSIGKQKIGGLFINDAYDCYRTWGAIAKLNDLESDYASYLPKSLNPLTTQAMFERKEKPLIPIDLLTVIKTSQAIAGEVTPSKLLARLMVITIENAGAEKGCIILSKNNQLFVEAEGKMNAEEVTLLKSVPVDGHPGLSPAIVNYVARTKETICLTNAGAEDRFIYDPYILEKKPQSILCSPLLNKGKLIGLLYFENNVAAGAFTAERLDILKMLSSQIAISIGNAMFYDNLEKKVAERTKELQTAVNELKAEVKIRRSKEEALRLSHHRLIRVLDSTSEGIIIVNHLNEVVFFNNGAESLLLFQATAIINTSASRLFPSESLHIFDELLRSFNSDYPPSRLSGKNNPVRVTMQRSDGSLFDADIYITAFSTKEEPFYSVIIRPLEGHTHTQTSKVKKGHIKNQGVDSSAIVSKKVFEIASGFNSRLSAIENAIRDISQNLYPEK